MSAQAGLKRFSRFKRHDDEKWAVNFGCHNPATFHNMLENGGENIYHVALQQFTKILIKLINITHLSSEKIINAE
jgi:hypothetical protein